MTPITFYKYHGTGNDFIIIDNRHLTVNKNNTKTIATLCHRRFGIGADGLILLENENLSDFKMVYYNADGNESTMCGNGGRCLVAFAKFLNIIHTQTTFSAIDGLHSAEIDNDSIKLQMQDVNTVIHKETYCFLNTGSPHHVQLVENLDDFDVVAKGKIIRNGSPYFTEGTNVNFVEQTTSDTFKVRTYERGVEDETLSCGTGVTAVAIAMHSIGKTKANIVNIITPGGNLKVTFSYTNNGYTNIWLIGPAIQVFKGQIQI